MSDSQKIRRIHTTGKGHQNFVEGLYPLNELRFFFIDLSL
jgi:hypothetical protein